ncbi:hypothetical protein Pmani_039733 [Petrolisthes manimaculis]|uniref:Uncharacterized protein n=1 Tax=Petrolisthes manimaculis TaxID=1843537 RepID=A0AAE1NEL5_9EUCA|nr:hypothetical protein Pmani_039733 [Petrolisthes manimaculis]
MGVISNSFLLPLSLTFSPSPSPTLFLFLSFSPLVHLLLSHISLSLPALARLPPPPLPLPPLPPYLTPPPPSLTPSLPALFPASASLYTASPSTSPAPPLTPPTLPLPASPVLFLTSPCLLRNPSLCLFLPHPAPFPLSLLHSTLPVYLLSLTTRPSTSLFLYTSPYSITTSCHFPSLTLYLPNPIL